MILCAGQCKQCGKFVNSKDLIIGLCPNCLTARLDSHREFAFPDGIDCVRCSDCNVLMVIDAFRHWDVLGRCWVMVCRKCNEKRIHKDAQYRNTEFAFEQRIQ